MTSVESKTYEDEMYDATKRLFSSPLGRKVLNHWLGHLYFFEEALTDEQVILKNFATRLMNGIGFQLENADVITECIMKQVGKKE